MTGGWREFVCWVAGAGGGCGWRVDGGCWVAGGGWMAGGGLLNIKLQWN